MTVTVTDFKPTSIIKDGKEGLATSRGSHSHVIIVGTNLADKLDVTVYCPPGSGTKAWTGKTYFTNQDKTRCRAKLDHVDSGASGRGGLGEGDTAVSVTVGDSTVKPFSVKTGPPLDGTYSLACNGAAGGTYKWLAPAGTTGVTLASASDAAPSWIFTLIANQQGDCYTIQCQMDGTTYYLKWANNGSNGTNASLVNAAGAGTAWLLDSDHLEAHDIPSNDPMPPYSPILNGDTSSGAVSMVGAANSSGSSWTMGAPSRLPRRT